MTFFLLLSLVLVLSTESMAAPGGGSSQTVSFDELLLVLQWPTSYCNTGMNRCNYPIPLVFTVHGLWLNKHSYGVDCGTPNSRSNLYRQISGDLRKDLEKYWPNLNSQGDREYLWEHEHQKHGHCFKEFRNHVVYFQTALDIATDIGNVMINMRLSSGNTITRGELYHVNDFKHVTIANRKLILGLRCNYAMNSAIPQLHEIVFCTDRNKTLKNCASNYVKDCGRPWKDSKGKVWTGWSDFLECQRRSCPTLPVHLLSEMQGNLVKDSELAFCRDINDFLPKPSARGTRTIRSNSTVVKKLNASICKTKNGYV